MPAGMFAPKHCTGPQERLSGRWVAPYVVAAFSPLAIGLLPAWGQKQRVAVSQALSNDPLIIMGEEPTGNLDNKNSEVIFDIFQELAHSSQQELLIVTPDQEFAARTHRIIEMEDRRIITPPPGLQP